MSSLYPLECPYCGYKEDPWYECFQEGAENGECYCSRCGKVYWVEIEYNEPDFYTDKAPCLNGKDEHELHYVYTATNLEDKNDIMRVCRFCDFGEVVDIEEVPEDVKEKILMFRESRNGY